MKEEGRGKETEEEDSEGCKRRGDVGGLKRRKSRGGRVKEVGEGEERRENRK